MLQDEQSVQFRAKIWPASITNVFVMFASKLNRECPEELSLFHTNSLLSGLQCIIKPRIKFSPFATDRIHTNANRDNFQCKICFTVIVTFYKIYFLKARYLHHILNSVFD